MGLETIYKPIKNELAETETRLKQALTYSDKYLAGLGKHLLKAKGKRLRPALVLLSSKLGKPNTAKAVDLAAAIEIIHTATLIHDDIVDNAKLRRQQPSLNVKFGLDASILFGDYLYSQAFQMVSFLNLSEITSVLLKTTSVICQGEIRQLHQPVRALQESEYFRLIADKTASLFSVCCETGGMIGGLGDKKVEQLKIYGQNLGVGFQIADDCLDLVGQEKEAGKSLQIDNKKGRLTLPLIYLKKFPKRTKFEAVNYARAESVKYQKRALTALDLFDDGAAKSSLTSLVDYVFSSINPERSTARC